MNLPRGRVFRRWGWSVMNRRHFFYVTQLWWNAGYEKALKDVAAGRPAPRGSIEQVWRRNS